MTRQEPQHEKCIIAAVFDPQKSDPEIQGILEEMKLLTESAGGNVIETFSQKKHPPDSRYLIGSGKIEEIKNFAREAEAQSIVFYNPLSNTQQRNLEQYFEIKVIDRTRLILDVFATRARSLEGKLQVELAQLLYLLPRLTGKGISLSRLGGGIGTRGPGETKLEADRRTIKKRISIIRKKLDKIIESRDMRRKHRKSNPVPVVSLVGYTSAGKSTLFRALTGEEVPISSMLFSTLDPVMRRVEIQEIREDYAFLISDTVGFIREMPEELFQSFKATLEEVINSDLILHVIDISNPDYLNRKEDVENVLEEMNITPERILHIYNKADLLPDYEAIMARQDDPEFADESRVYISAIENRGVTQLKKAIYKKYFKDFRPYTLAIPPKEVNLDSIKKWAIVVKQYYLDGRLNIDILSSKENMLKFKEKHGGYVK